MREITHGDIRAAARVLLVRPAADWPHVMAQMLDEAHCADRYRKSFGRHHPRLGNGTLMSAALARKPVPEPPASDPRYLATLAASIEAVLSWRMGRAKLPAEGEQSGAAALRGWVGGPSAGSRRR